MKLIIKSILGIIITAIHLFATTAEWSFHINNNAAQKMVKITIQQVEPYAWTWRNNQVVLSSVFNFVDSSNATTKAFKFDSPTSEGYTKIPWGVMRMIIYINDTLRLNRKIDFRDEEWSTNEIKYPSHDAGIIIDIAANTIKVYTSKDSAHYFGPADTTIWEIWRTTNPNQTSLIPPVFLKNIITGTNAGGTLHIDALHYVSGDTVLKEHNQSYIIGTDNERFSNYQSSGITYKHNNWHGASIDDSLSRNVFLTDDRDEQFANFASLSSATVKAQLLETGAIGEVELRDPWYVADANNSQPDTFFAVTSASNYIPTGKYNLTTGGVFLNQDPTTQSIYYSVRAPLVKTIGIVPSYFQNWSTTNVDLPLPTNIVSGYYETPAIFRDGTSRSIIANYKGSLASNTAGAMSEPSQRKVVRSGNGNYFVTYESMGKVWVEYSTNEGTTWQLANSGQPLGTGVTPSLTPFAGGALVVYDAGAAPKMYYVTATSAVNYGFEYNYDMHPLNVVVSTAEAGDIVVMWKEASVGICYSLATYYMNGNNPVITWFVNSATLSGSNTNSYTPAVDCKGNVFQIAWEQVSGGSSSICYSSLTRQANGTYTQGSVQTMSSGYPLNYKPSIIATTEPGARICWISDDTEESSPMAIFHDPGYYYYWYFGWDVTSAHINASPTNYVLGWANGDGSHQYTNSGHLGSPQSLSSTGGYVQIANSSSSSTMRSLGFNAGSSPYRFNLSSAIPLYKSKTEDITHGRGGMITAHDAQFMFLLGDIQAAGEKIEFIDMPDTVRLEEIALLNHYLESEPFALNDNTPLSYSVQYRTRDSAAAAAELAGNKNVTFDVELVDVSSNVVIGVFDHCVYSSENVVRHNSIGYTVDTKGIGARTVKLRLRIHTNIDASFAVINRAATGSMLGKKGSERRQMSFRGSLAVTEYALEQNFPNPFNPVTTISYALPQDGMTTLKIYDALGREVKTLVNEFKTTGRYTSEFDASRLSSGVYIYKLVSDKYSAVKKMLLVK